MPFHRTSRLRQLRPLAAADALQSVAFDAVESVASDRGGWWMPFAVGAVAGFLAASLVRRRRPERPSPRADSGPSSDWPRLSEAWEGAVEGLASARSYVLRPTDLDLDLDLEGVRAHVASMPGGEAVRVGFLGSGIVELIGTVPDEDLARRLLESVAAQPGVEVVVNRIWTPTSSGTTPDIVTDPS